MELLNAQKRLKIDSYIHPEEGRARLDFEDGSFYRGGWKGSIGITPIKEEAAGILELYDVEGRKEGLGHLHVEGVSDYAGSFEQGKMHGYGILKRTYKTTAPNLPKSETLEGYFRKGKVVGPAYHVATYAKGTRTTFGWFSQGKLVFKSVALALILVVIRGLAGRAHANGLDEGEKAVKKTGSAAKAGSNSGEDRQDKMGGGRRGVSKAKDMIEVGWEMAALGFAMPTIIWSYFYIHQYVVPNRWVGYAYLASTLLVHALLSAKVGLAGKDAARHRKSPFMGAFFFASVIYTIVTYNVSVFPYLPFAHTIWFNLVATFTVTFYTVARATDPGFLPQHLDGLTPYMIEEVRARFDICETCGILRVRRSKHCKHCMRCVQDFDHHCPGIHHCVGARNHVYFWAFVVGLATAHILYIVGAVKTGNLSYDDASWASLPNSTLPFVWRWACDHTHLFGGSMYQFFSFLMQSSLVIYHTRGILFNLTTNEGINWHKYEYLRKEASEEGKKKKDSDGVIEAKQVGMGMGGSELRNRGGGVTTADASAGRGGGDEKKSMYDSTGALLHFAGTSVRVVAKRDIADQQKPGDAKYKFVNTNNKGVLKNIKYALSPPSPHVESIAEVYTRMQHPSSAASLFDGSDESLDEALKRDIPAEGCV